MGNLNHTPSAVAETVTMAPARKQNITPLARLYSVTSLPAADLLQLVVERQARPRGDRAQQEDPAQHGQHVAHDQADDDVERADAGQATNSGPIINSVPAVCSPAYMPDRSS